MSIKTDVTLKRLIYELSVWANDHKMIDRFGYGDFLELYEDGPNSYPYLMVNSSNGNDTMWYQKYLLEVCIMDFVWDNNENHERVESDTLQILRDLTNTMRYSNRWQSFARVNNTDQPERKFIEKGGDKVWGWCITIDLWIKQRSGICDLEAIMPEYDFETQTNIIPPCAPATYKNSSGSFEKEIASGASFTSDDIEVTVNDTSQGNFPTNEDIEITVAGLSSAFLAITGQENKVVDDDDGDQFLLGTYDNEILADFYTLKEDNEWGHKKRFTGDTGGYMDEATGDFFDVDDNPTDKAGAFPNNILRDYGFRLRWFLNRSGSRTWANAVSLATTDSVGGETGWRLPNLREYESISSNNSLSPTYIDSRLFNWSNFLMWSSSTLKTNTARAFRFQAGTSDVLQQPKTLQAGGAYIKNF